MQPNNDRSSRTTRVRCHVDAPRAAVYRLLIDPDAIVRWKVPNGMTSHIHTFEPHTGGAIRVSLTYDAPDSAGKTTAHTDTYRGRFLQLVENELVVEADEFETSDPSLCGEMISTITLTDSANGGTDVAGVHEGVPPGVSLTDNETGWKMAFAKLAALATAAAGPPIAVRHAKRSEHERLDELYKTWGYGGGIAPDDVVFVAHDAGKPVGLVRRTVEHGFTMLRGMYLDPAYRRRGIGSLLLEAFADEVRGTECFCVPLGHLIAFYARIGFAIFPEDAAPEFLKARLREYRHQGLDVLIMRRPADSSLDHAASP